MPQIIEVPGHGQVEFPDGMSDQDIVAAIQRNAPKQAPANPTDGMSGWERAQAGFGKAFVDVGRGAGQLLGLVDQASIDEAKKRDAPLMETGAGLTGNVVGNIAAAAPMLAIPGANTVGGAALTGAAQMALQPTASDESRLQNVALGAATGGAAQYGMGKAANFLGNRLAKAEAAGVLKQGQNSVMDTGIQEAKDLGYKTVPSVSNGNLLGRTIEGVTGKEKAKQLASVKNQTVTNTRVREALGLPPDAPLSVETMRSIRADAASKGYEPVRQIPRMRTDNVFRNDVAALTSRADNAAKDFGELVKSDVQPLADGLKNVKSFTGDSAVDAVSEFREKASDLYAAGNKTLGKAYRKAAEAIESQIDRGLGKSGRDGANMIKDYRAARTRMAQTFDVEKALREGQGNVDARALGKIYAKNPDRMSGKLQSIGRAASAMPDVMSVPKDGWANPVTALDSGFATFGGILAGNPAPLAYPLARAAGRYGLLTDAGQKMFTKPDYAPGLLQSLPPKALKQLEDLGLSGLLGSAVYGAQQ